jgi:predicted metal-binding protein
MTGEPTEPGARSSASCRHYPLAGAEIMTAEATIRQAVVLICTTCGSAGAPAGTPPAGLLLARSTVAFVGDAGDVRIEGVRCLASCSRGPSAAIRCDGAWTYIFGHLDQARDGPALVEGARLLASAADGLLPWRGRPEVLKRATIARLPPDDIPGEVVALGPTD